MNEEKKVLDYYVRIVMDKPDHILVANSYERYCVYNALEKYAKNFQSVWFNKSYKKEIRYAEKDTCKYCFRKKKDCTNVADYETCGWESYCGGDIYYKCKTCGGTKIWLKGYEMFEEKIPYKINIYYNPKKKMRCFEH